jgi:DNA-binding transcriptional LysR family regulator
MTRRRSPAVVAAPDPAALVLFACIAEAGSLTAAARQLGTTQPALSKQLKRLEQGLGVPVFDRSMRGVQPTEYGAALLPHGRSIREQAAQAGEEVAQRRGLREGRLRIALSHFATIALLPRVIPAFRERWPGVRLDIAPPSFDLFGLREGTPHFAVVSLPVERLGTEFSARAVYATTVAVVARPGHPLAKARRLAELAQAEWVLPSLKSSTARGLEKAFRKARLPLPRCMVTCETLTGLETLVAHTDLVAAIPLEVQRARAPANGLQRVPVEEPIEGPRVAIVRWADTHPTPAAADLEQAFVQAGQALARERGKR